MNIVLLFMLANGVGGKVFDIESNEPLQAHIYLPNLNQAFPCDSQGKFSIDELPAGDCNLIINHIGFKAESLSVAIPKEGYVHVGVGLKPVPIALKMVVISASKPVTPHPQVVTQEEIVTIPGAEKDVFRVIQVLPGVSTPSDYLGLIFARGGDLYENQVMFDNMEILSPYHYFGIGSVFNTDLVGDFEFCTGSFPARYGSAISSVLNLSSTKADSTIGGTISADLIETSWLYSCPVSRDVALVLSSKRNYLDLLLNKTGIVKDVILPYYIDHQGQIIINSKIGAFNVNGLKSREEINLETSFADETIKLEVSGYSNSIASGWNKKFSKNVTLSLDLFYSDSKRTLFGALPPYGDVSEETRQKKYGVVLHDRFDLENIGFEIGGGLGRYSFFHQGEQVEDLLYGYDQFEYSFDVDTSDNYKYIYSAQRFNTLKPIICELGERIDWFPIIGKPVFSPRIRFSYEKSPNIYVAYGHQHQSPPFQYHLQKPKSTYAKCMTFGIEQAIRTKFLARLELYDKNYYNIVTIHESPEVPTFFETEGRGFARGVEISIKKHKADRTFGWMSYAYAVSKRSSPYDTALTAMPAYRPHIFNVAVGRTFKNGYEFGAKFQWSSGSPWNDVIGTAWDSVRGRWLPVYAPDRSRLPSYLRLDIHLQKTFSILGFNGDFYVTILNVTNHRNIQSYFYDSDYTVRKAFYMIPRVPLLGVKLRF